jgi:hypothetical protein
MLLNESLASVAVVGVGAAEVEGNAVLREDEEVDAGGLSSNVAATMGGDGVLGSAVDVEEEEEETGGETRAELAVEVDVEVECGGEATWVERMGGEGIESVGGTRSGSVRVDEETDEKNESPFEMPMRTPLVTMAFGDCGT